MRKESKWECAKKEEKTGTIAREREWESWRLFCWFQHIKNWRSWLAVMGHIYRWKTKSKLSARRNEGHEKQAAQANTEEKKKHNMPNECTAQHSTAQTNDYQKEPKKMENDSW